MDTPAPAEPTAPTEPTEQKSATQSWLKLPSLKFFVLCSLLLHGGLGVSWGVPAYIKDQEAKRLALEAIERAEQQKKTMEKVVDRARQESLDATREKVADLLKKTLEKIIQNDISEARKEKVWDATKKDMTQEIENVAKALNDATASESTVKNLLEQANTKMVGELAEALADDMGHSLAERFVRKIEGEIAIKMAEHYRQQVDEKTGGSVRREAEEIDKKKREEIAKGAGGRVRHHDADAVRGAYEVLRDGPMPATLTGEFKGQFGTTASPRLTGVMSTVFKKLMETNNIHDEKLLPDVEKQVQSTLSEKVPEGTLAASAGTRRLEEFTRGALKLDPKQSQPLIDEVKTASDTTVKRTLGEVVADASADAKFAELASKLTLSQAEMALRDRVDIMAENAKAGRVLNLPGSATSTALSEIREGALAREASIDAVAAGGAQTDLSSAAADAAAAAAAAAGGADGAAGAQSAEATKAALNEALKGEFDKLVGNDLQEATKDKTWKGVENQIAGDVSKMANALSDASVSPQDLAGMNRDLGQKFVGAVREQTVKSLGEEMADKLIAKVNGEIGAKIADHYKKEMTRAVGDNLRRNLDGLAQQERKAADEQVKDLRPLIDAVRPLADKTAISTEQAKKSSAKLGNDKNGKVAGDLTKQLEGLAESVETAQGELKKVTAASASTSEELQGKVAAASAKLDAVKATLEKGKAELAAGKAQETSAAISESAAAAKEFKGALGELSVAAGKEADAAAKRVKDASLAVRDSNGFSEALNNAFDPNFKGKAAPRLAEALTGTLRDQLEKAGLSNDKLLAATQGKVQSALGEKVTGASIGDSVLKPVTGDFLKGAAASDSAATKAVAEKVKAEAKETAEKGSAETTGNASADGRFAGMVGTLGDASVAAGLLDRFSQAEGNLANGRAEFMGAGLAAMRAAALAAAAAGQGAGAGAASGKPGVAANGKPGGGSSGQGLGPMGEYLPGGNLRYGLDQRIFDKDKYDKATDGMQERDAAAKGKTWEMTQAEGFASRAARNADATKPAGILTPKDGPAPAMTNADPYAPTFKTIVFTVAPYLNKPVNIDGDISEWRSQPALTMKRYTKPGKNIDGLKPADSINAWLAWDASGLYLAFDVVDPNRAINKATPRDFWLADTVEVWFDAMNIKQKQRALASGQQFWIWPFGSKDVADDAGGESLKDLHRNYQAVPFGLDKMQRAAKPTENGYTMEIRIPAERIRNADFSAGKIAGLNMTVETGTPMHYYWSMSKEVETYARPDTWGDVLLGGSDGTLEIPEKLTAEAGPGEASKAMTAFLIGEPLRLRVTDRDMNLSPIQKDKVSVTVRAGAGDSETVILEETGVDTGLFEGSVRTALSLGEKVPGTVSVYEGSTIDVLYTDQARANGARNTELKFKVKAASTLMVAGAK